MYPNLLFIGAQKAGTSWLADGLGRHEDIFVPPSKEIHYFDTFGDDSKKVQRRFKNHHADDVKSRDDFDDDTYDWWLNFLAGRSKSRYWYQSLFPSSGYKVLVDCTPAYSALSMKDINLVHRLIPETKILFIMRNPIERAWSQLCYEFRPKATSKRKSAKPPKFEDGVASMTISEMKKNISRRHIIARTRYARTMNNWENYFDSDLFFYDFYESVFENPNNFYDRLFRFLDISTRSQDFEKTKHQRINQTTGRIRAPDEIRAYLKDKTTGIVKRVQDRVGYVPDSWLDDYPEFARHQ